MKIFDSHTHIYPERIAEKATAGIAEFYDMPVRREGTAADLIRLLDRSSASGAMICSVATTPEQVVTINDFLARSVEESFANSESPVFFVGFGSLHPSMSESELDAEITRIIGLGLKGIKLHPDFQRFDADGKDAFKVYEVIGDRLPLLIHAGDERFSFSTPKRLANALDRFPNLTMIAAHLGGWSEWKEAALVLAGKENLYVDSSSSLYALTPEKARRYIGVFGEDRVLFGTDYPMWNIHDELELLDRLELSDSARENILYNNAKQLLKF